MATAMQEIFPILEKAESSLGQIKQKGHWQQYVCLSLKWVFDPHDWWSFMERIDRLKWSALFGPMWRAVGARGFISLLPSSWTNSPYPNREYGLN